MPPLDPPSFVLETVPPDDDPPDEDEPEPPPADEEPLCDDDPLDEDDAGPELDPPPLVDDPPLSDEKLLCDDDSLDEDDAGPELDDPPPVDDSPAGLPEVPLQAVTKRAMMLKVFDRTKRISVLRVVVGGFGNDARGARMNSHESHHVLGEGTVRIVLNEELSPIMGLADLPEG